MAFKPYVTSWDIQGFNAISFTHSNQKEIPLVNQEGVLSIAVLCGAHIDQEAIDYVSKNPMKHFAAFEIPAVYDLTEGALHHFKKRPLIGYAYYGFIRRYLEQNFDPPKVTPSHGNNR